MSTINDNDNNIRKKREHYYVVGTTLTGTLTMISLSELWAFNGNANDITQLALLHVLSNVSLFCSLKTHSNTNIWCYVCEKNKRRKWPIFSANMGNLLLVEYY